MDGLNLNMINFDLISLNMYALRSEFIRQIKIYLCRIYIELTKIINLLTNNWFLVMYFLEASMPNKFKGACVRRL